MAKKLTTAADYAARYVERFGFALVPIEPGRKFPQAQNWGRRVITDAAKAREYYEKKPDWNMGAALGPSGLCSLDIDCAESFAAIADAFGIDLPDLDQCPTIQGASKGRRVVFRVPEGVALPYCKLTWPSRNDPDGSKHREAIKAASSAVDAGDETRAERIRAVAKRWARYTVLELRAACDGKQRQDVLPPSIHPDTGQPYRWLTQPCDDWPEPPPWLLACWTNWDDFKPQFASVCPWAPTETAQSYQAKPKPQTETRGDSVIDAYLQQHAVTEELTRYGYKPVGKRWLSPHSTTKLPGVVLLPDQHAVWIHHASDPLCSEESGQPVNAFDLYCYYDHGGDVSKAVKAAADMLGLRRKRQPTEVARQHAHASASDQSDEARPADEASASSRVPRRGYFQPLGYDGNRYYYLPAATEQVVDIKRSAHTSPAELMGLAPLEWWEAAYPNKNGCDWQAAASDLMRQCERRGIYSAERQRGRGAWYDDGKAVLHLGDRLLVNGQPCPISEHASRYVYTRQASTDSDVGTVPASEETAWAVRKIIEDLNWSGPTDAMLCVGWVALAPICGALSWRPHAWLTAKRGAGKSWMLDHIVSPLLGRSALHVQGSTTEAGIRQRLQQDARPIVFDEAEAEGQPGARRIQSVLELARQASSDSGAEIAKGTASGEGMSFRARSMFLLGSINVSLSQAADESRFSVLTLNAPDKTPAEVERFHQYARHVDATLTRETCAAIRARMYRMIPTVRRNAETFARAVAEVLGSQRIGDQVGTLLAGAHCLTSSEVVSLDKARDLAAMLDLSEAEQSEQVSDERMCADHLLQCQIRIEGTDGRPMTRTVAELILAASHRRVYQALDPDACDHTLQRHGLRVDGDALLVANKHAEVARMLRDTAWAGSWKTVLRRIDGATAGSQPARMAGVLARHVRVPLDVLL